MSNKSGVISMGARLRGALVVLEGCDRAGKTTQCRKLVSALTDAGIPTKEMHFPDRSTILGKQIDQYLKMEQQLDDHAIHLLFSANRWEHESEMRQLLRTGTTLVVDRYAYSGVAFTSAKQVANLEWCKGPDRGLPAPDVVFYLTLSPEAAKQRADYGGERYEKEKFQQQVSKQFELLRKEDSKRWEEVDASRDIDTIHQELVTRTKEVIANIKGDLEQLWV